MIEQYLREELALHFIRPVDGLLYLREGWFPPTAGDQSLFLENSFLDGEPLAFTTTSGRLRRVWYLCRDAGLDGTTWPPQRDCVNPRSLTVDPASIRLGQPSVNAQSGGTCPPDVIEREKGYAAIAMACWAKYRQQVPAKKAAPVAVVATLAPVEVATSAPKKPWYQFWS